MSAVSKQEHNPEEWLNGLVDNITHKTSPLSSKFQEKPKLKPKKIEAFQERYQHFRTKPQKNLKSNQDKIREKTHSTFKEVYQKIRKDIKIVTGKNINISESILQKLTNKACSSLENQEQEQEMPNTKDIKKECQKAIVSHLLKNQTVNKQEIRDINEMNKNRRKTTKTVLESERPEQATTLGGQIKNWKDNPSPKPKSHSPSL